MLFIENKHYFYCATNRDEAGAGARAARRVMMNAYLNGIQANLMELICNRLSLIKNDQLKLKFVENEEKTGFVHITSGEGIETTWEEIQEENEKYWRMNLKIKMY